MRLDQALARLLPEHSRSRLQAWLRAGHILLDTMPAQPKQKLWGGECILMVPQPDAKETAARPEAIELAVVFEDEALIVIDKPAGMVVHPGSGNWQGTMMNALLHHAPQLCGIPRAGIVHRLDKDTSGLLVVAKTLHAHTDLVRQLQARTVKRDYLALACGAVRSDGEIEAPIGRHPRHRTRMAVVPGGRPALTFYRVLKRFRDATLLECSLSTGRTHQIRVHLHSHGHPLVGDRVYRPGALRNTSPQLARFPRQALHAARLEFVHPLAREPRRFASPLPPDIADLIASLS